MVHEFLCILYLSKFLQSVILTFICIYIFLCISLYRTCFILLKYFCNSSYYFRIFGTVMQRPRNAQIQLYRGKRGENRVYKNQILEKSFSYGIRLLLPILWPWRLFPGNQIFHPLILLKICFLKAMTYTYGICGPLKLSVDNASWLNVTYFASFLSGRALGIVISRLPQCLTILKVHFRSFFQAILPKKLNFC